MSFKEWKKQYLQEGIEKFLDKVDLTDEQRQEIIDHFNKYPNKTKLVNWHKKDLSYEDIKKAMETTSKRQKKKANLKRGKDFYYFKNDKLEAIFPLNHQAMRYFGKDSKWCVAGNDSDYWDSYIERSQVLVIFNIDNEKYLCAYTYNGNIVELANLYNEHIDIDDYDEDEEDEYTEEALYDFKLYDKLDNMINNKKFPEFIEFFKKTKDYYKSVNNYKKEFLDLINYTDFTKEIDNKFSELVKKLNEYNINIIDKIFFKRELFKHENFLKNIKKYDRYEELYFIYIINGISGGEDFEKSEIEKLNIPKNNMLKLAMSYYPLALKNKKVFDIVIENTDLKSLKNNRDFIYFFIDEFLFDEIKYLSWLEEYDIYLNCKTLNQDMLKKLVNKNDLIYIYPENINYLKIILERLLNFFGRLGLENILEWSYNYFENISGEKIIQLCKLSINHNHSFLYNTELRKKMLTSMKIFEYFCKNFEGIIVDTFYSIKCDDVYYLDRIKIINKYSNPKFKKMMKEDGGYIVSSDYSTPKINSEILDFILSDENEIIDPYVKTTFRALNYSLNKGITTDDYIKFLDKFYEEAKNYNSDTAYIVLRNLSGELPLEIYIKFAEYEKQLIKNASSFIERIVNLIKNDKTKIEFIEYIKKNHKNYGLNENGLKWLNSLLTEITGEENDEEIQQESKETLSEIPHIKINDNYFDLELEKQQDINDFIYFFKQIFSGKEIKDKYNDIISLNTIKDKIDFLKSLRKNNLFMNILKKVRKEYYDFDFFNFFRVFINSQQENNELEKENIYEKLVREYINKSIK